MALILWALLIVVVLAVSFYFWPKDQRTLKTVVITGAVIGALVGSGILIARSIPVTRKETVEKVVVLKYKKPPQVVYRDKIVYRIPGKEFDPVNTESACKGGVTLILDQVTKSGKDDDHITWVLGHQPGSRVQITCRIPGSYDDFYKAGSVIQLPANGQNN